MSLSGGLDPENRRRLIQAAGAILALLALATLVTLQFKPATPERPPSGFHTYSVNARVQIERNGSAGICSGFVNEAGCTVTIPLQIDVASLPLQQTFLNGIIWTPILELTGTWTGKTLVVTSPVKRAAAYTPMGRPGLNSGNAPNEPTEAMLGNQQRLIADDVSLRDKGILILESGWSKAGFYVIVAAADHPTLDYVKATYHADVVSSWFRLLS